MATQTGNEGISYAEQTKGVKASVVCSAMSTHRRITQWEWLVDILPGLSGGKLWCAPPFLITGVVEKQTIIIGHGPRCNVIWFMVHLNLPPCIRLYDQNQILFQKNYIGLKVLGRPPV